MTKVEYSLAAENDIRTIYNWVADAADADTAKDYVQRIRDRCDRLANFPERGTPRDDVAPGLRTFGFERRAVVAYMVDDATVRILRILHKGRDLGREFGL